MHKTGTKEYMKAYAKKWYQRIKADPERLAQHRANCHRWYLKHKQQMIDDPEYQKHTKDKMQQATKRYLEGMSESQRKALQRKYYDSYMNRIKSDPERLEKYKQKIAQATKKSYEKRKARLHQQGLTVRGTPFYKPKVKPEPKPTVWEIKTGKTLQSWAEQLGVTREAVRMKFLKAQKTLTDSEQVFEQMRSNGEWPETVRLKFESITGVKK